MLSDPSSSRLLPAAPVCHATFASSSSCRTAATIMRHANSSESAGAIRWLHIPKTGSTFAIAIYAYACPAVNITEAAQLLEDDCSQPMVAMTGPFPPSAWCSDELLIDRNSGRPQLGGGGSDLDNHISPIYPDDVGLVVSLFREPAELKASFLSFMTNLVVSEEAYAVPCGVDANDFLETCASDDLAQAGPAAVPLPTALIGFAAQVMGDGGEAADARCELLAYAVPRLRGGQARMALNGSGYLGSDAEAAQLEGGGTPEWAADEAAVWERMREYLAFAGLTGRFADSVCAFQLAFGLAPQRAAASAHARSTPDLGIDWQEEGERCGYALDDDPLDGWVYQAATRMLEETIEEIEATQPGAMAACSAAAVEDTTMQQHEHTCGRSCMMRLLLMGALIGCFLSCVGLRTSRRQDMRKSEWHQQQDHTPDMDMEVVRHVKFDL